MAKLGSNMEQNDGRVPSEREQRIEAMGFAVEQVVCAIDGEIDLYANLLALGENERAMQGVKRLRAVRSELNKRWTDLLLSMLGEPPPTVTIVGFGDTYPETQQEFARGLEALGGDPATALFLDIVGDVELRIDGIVDYDLTHGRKSGRPGVLGVIMPSASDGLPTHSMWERFEDERPRLSAVVNAVEEAARHPLVPVRAKRALNRGIAWLVERSLGFVR